MLLALRFLAALAIASHLGCGGDGASGPRITFQPASLSFTAKQGDPRPPAQSIRFHLSDTQLLFGSGWAGAQPQWIREPTFATIPGHISNWSQTYEVTLTGLPPGTYTAALEVRISEPGPLWPPKLLEMWTIPVTYTVTAP